MIEVTQYKCEICGTIYDNAETCEKCEAYHTDVNKVSEYKYHPRGVGPEAKYPYAVVLKMDDNTLLTFKR